MQNYPLIIPFTPSYLEHCHPPDIPEIPLKKDVKSKALHMSIEYIVSSSVAQILIALP